MNHNFQTINCEQWKERLENIEPGSTKREKQLTSKTDSRPFLQQGVANSSLTFRGFNKITSASGENQAELVLQASQHVGHWIPHEDRNQSKDNVRRPWGLELLQSSFWPHSLRICSARQASVTRLFSGYMVLIFTLVSPGFTVWFWFTLPGLKKWLEPGGNPINMARPCYQAMFCSGFLLLHFCRIFMIEKAIFVSDAAVEQKKFTSRTWWEVERQTSARELFFLRSRTQADLVGFLFTAEVINTLVTESLHGKWRWVRRTSLDSQCSVSFQNVQDSFNVNQIKALKPGVLVLLVKELTQMFNLSSWWLFHHLMAVIPSWLWRTLPLTLKSKLHWFQALRLRLICAESAEVAASFPSQSLFPEFRPWPSHCLRSLAQVMLTALLPHCFQIIYVHWQLSLTNVVIFGQKNNFPFAAWFLDWEYFNDKNETRTVPSNNLCDIVWLINDDHWSGLAQVGVGTVLFFRFEYDSPYKSHLRPTWHCIVTKLFYTAWCGQQKETLNSIVADNKTFSTLIHSLQYTKLIPFAYYQGE